ncbi:MAG TPA: 2-isopropylmalate synthase [Candidatus Caccalectryoclostridium excrementigallinarum]|uniref:2-isopropylmalate synthase n=1 Tax=Candidatus Caccalectryoclostridium excrementigallinarum TaxID=2840710 RepID=A0A9D1SKR2_9FIRM|nr:2-isopropylmalate synthase [Candidatus Caccalectryoclostridium excrementigallinarum]
MIRMDSHRNVLTDRNWSPTLQDVSEPNLFREIYDYDSIPKTAFNFRNTPMDMPEDIWMTDTTFRDGQQSTSPFTVKQIVELYRLMHRLGGKKGMIKQCEFFLYTEKDRKAVEECQQLGYEFPEITSWIRANKKDFDLVKAMGIKETGILVSCSDYHIFKKMHLTRRQAADQYLGIVKEALSKGIVPRCHFEDITRADFYGFVVPFAIELMKLSEEAGIPVKIRACDTLGYGISYPGVTLPRSVPGIIAGLKYYAQVPSAQLEWHGHNDFYKVVTNSATAWLYGCSSVNCSLLGIGERTGNCPLEAMVIEYASLRGTTDGMDISVITEIADYFEKEMGYSIPPRTPFVGRNFNTTRAGVHADGLLKDVEIYNIFNTEKLLNRVPLVSVDSHSGLAGIAYWINGYYKLSKDHEIDKKHEIVVKMKEYIDDLYAKGRNTCMGDEEMDEILRHIDPKLHKKLIDAATGEDY